MLDQAAQASEIQFTYRFEPVDELFTVDASMNLYRIVQESLPNNILKHSGARHVAVQLERDIHEVQLRNRGRWRGVEPGEVPTQAGSRV